MSKSRNTASVMSAVVPAFPRVCTCEGQRSTRTCSKTAVLPSLTRRATLVRSSIVTRVKRPLAASVTAMPTLPPETRQPSTTGEPPSVESTAAFPASRTVHSSNRPRPADPTLMPVSRHRAKVHPRTTGSAPLVTAIPCWASVTRVLSTEPLDCSMKQIPSACTASMAHPATVSSACVSATTAARPVPVSSHPVTSARAPLTRTPWIRLPSIRLSRTVTSAPSITAIALSVASVNRHRSTSPRAPLKRARPCSTTLSRSVSEVLGLACTPTPLYARISTRSRVSVPAWQATVSASRPVRTRPSTPTVP